MKIVVSAKNKNFRNELNCICFAHDHVPKQYHTTLFFSLDKLFPFIVRINNDNSPIKNPERVFDLSKINFYSETTYFFIYDDLIHHTIPESKKQILYDLKLKNPAWVEWKHSSCLVYIQRKNATQKDIENVITKTIQSSSLLPKNVYVYSNIPINIIEMNKNTPSQTSMFHVHQFGDMWEISKNCDQFMYMCDTPSSLEEEFMTMNPYSHTTNMGLNINE